MIQLPNIKGVVFREYLGTLKTVCPKNFRRLIKNKHQNPLKYTLPFGKQFCFYRLVFWKNQGHVHKGIPIE